MVTARSLRPPPARAPGRRAVGASSPLQPPAAAQGETAAPGRAETYRSTDGAEPGSGLPADSVMNHTAAPPTTAAAIM